MLSLNRVNDESASMMNSPISAVFIIGAVLVASIAAAESTSGDPQRGASLYVEYKCHACHGYTGETGSGTKLNPPRFELEAFVAYVRRPSGQVVQFGSGGTMPPYAADNVPDQDLIDVYLFLKSLPSTSPPLDEIPLLQD